MVSRALFADEQMCGVESRINAGRYDSSKLHCNDGEDLVNLCGTSSFLSCAKDLIAMIRLEHKETAVENARLSRSIWRGRRIELVIELEVAKVRAQVGRYPTDRSVIGPLDIMRGQAIKGH